MRFALALVFVPALAFADPSFEVVDRGDAVEVIAHQLKAARTTVSPIRQRLEVPLVGAPIVPRQMATDPTVLQIELDGDSPRVLSVKLRLERPDVHSLARFAQAIQVGDDLHLLFPRKVPAEGVTPALPEPTIPKALAPAVAAATMPAPKTAPKPAAIASQAATPAAIPAAASTSAQVPAVVPAADPIPAPTPAPATATTGAPIPKQTSSDDSPLSNASLYGALALVAVGIAAWLTKRRRAQVVPGSTIDVVAQRALGGKVKVVWLAAGNREMIVAVAAQQVRMLGQWARNDSTRSASAALPAAHALGGRDSTAGSSAEWRSGAVEDGGPRPAVSPVVQGILKLRERAATAQPIVNPEVATDDADADMVWAKEILAATGTRR